MIIEQQGDIFQSGAMAMVNPVNCIGEMGKGLAAAFKRQYPDNFYYYRRVCEKGLMQPGKVLTVPMPGNNPHYVINFPTKRHWKDKTYMEDIEMGLQDLARVLHRLQIQSIAIPALGCGLGGLDWQVVKPIIMEALRPFDAMDIMLYGPQDKAK